MLGAGIRVTRIQADWKELDVEMRLRWWNANYVGTHYGGSLYSITDPFFMVMLIRILGPDYIVWDKAASIRFRRPGRSTVYAKFRMTDEQVNEIRETLKTEEKFEREFAIEVKDAEGDGDCGGEEVVAFSEEGGGEKIMENAPGRYNACALEKGARLGRRPLQG